MSRQAPPAREQEQGVVLQSIVGLILDAEDLGRGPPEVTDPFRSAN
jgi:hypothetical protein